MIDQSPSQTDAEPDEELEASSARQTTPIEIALGAEAVGQRLDRALAAALDPALGLSRSRLRALIEQGALAEESGATLRDPSAKVKSAGMLRLVPPPPRAATPQPEAIPLRIVYEDEALLVIDKPAGIAVHPAPGSETGTLVNAALAHCGDTLSGVGGELRPGIVHRIDKETSGLLVMAKSDRAHQGLSAQFAAHSIERVYQAIAWGAPDRSDPRIMGLRGLEFRRRGEEDAGLWGRIETEIARSRADRKKMAPVFSGGKRAVTWFRLTERFGAEGAWRASEVECRLETGRTHQIRVHLAYAGHGLIGDPLYGRASASRIGGLTEPARSLASGFRRQALHAGALGFEHPLSGARLSFTAPPPEDFQTLRESLRKI